MRTPSDLLAAHGGLLIRRDLSAAAVAVAEHALRRGDLVAVLPGVYAHVDDAALPSLRARAVLARFPNAVLSGRTAAALTFWPELTVSTVHAAGVKHACERPGFSFSRRRIDSDWVIEIDGLRLTTPALTAIELADSTDGESIDRALRSRRVTLAQLHAALSAHPGCPGNRERRRLLLDSRDEPWSTAERLVHRLLREAGLRGWSANRGIRVGNRTYHPDLAFPRERLCVEIDGYAFHSSLDAFETDRERQNDLADAGWLVLRFTWRMLTDDPADVIRRIRSALRQRAAIASR